MRGSLVAIAISVLACGGGGGSKKPVNKPKSGAKKPSGDSRESEADREKKRLAQARKIVPEGSNCLPVALKPGDGAPRLEIGAVDGKPVVCAIDTDTSRLLGPVACWTLDHAKNELT